jgi:hypothetical protein
LSISPKAPLQKQDSVHECGWIVRGVGVDGGGVVETVGAGVMIVTVPPLVTVRVVCAVPVTATVVGLPVPAAGGV